MNRWTNESATPASPKFRPLDHASFGVLMEWDQECSRLANDELVAAEDMVRSQFHEAGGLLVIKGLHDLQTAPEQLVRISRIFGPEVEDYRHTLTAARFFHDKVPEILVLSNAPPCNHPPPTQPNSGRYKSGKLVTQFPNQKNWHTDQSYRRPPPDVSLLYGIIIPPSNQGQTLYADCTATFAALDPEMQHRLRKLCGIHAPSWIGRTPDDVRKGVNPRPLLHHQLPQR